MKKTKLTIIIIVLVIIENILLWYAAIFYYEGKLHDIRIKSKEGQVEVCKSISLSESLYFVLKKMDQYSPDLIYINPLGQLNLSYGSEASKGFAVGAGVGFDFDENYKLIHKSCEGVSEPEFGKPFQR